MIGRWTRDLLSGINFMHDRDPCIIHRDLKPANLVLVPDLSQLKILDFGVGKMVRSA
jgi:serine/threonine protein kinase